MRRGEVWTVSGGKDYATKPRPVVIEQDDSFDATDSITICAFTTDPMTRRCFASSQSLRTATACVRSAS